MRTTPRTLLLAALTAFGITFFSYHSFTAIAQFIGPGNCAAGMCSGSIALDSNGDIGFGASATTTARLYVVGSSTAGSYALKASGTIYSATGGFKFPDGTTQTTAATAGSGTVSTTAENVKAGAFGANWSGGNYSFPGSVGIGTTTPGARLEIAQASDNNALILSNSSLSGWKGWLFYNHTNSSNSDLRMYEVGGGDKVTFQSGGNVGIGTTAPTYKVDVNGTGRFAQTLTLDTPTVATNPHLLFTTEGGVADLKMSAAGDFRFANAAYTQVNLRIADNGDVTTRGTMVGSTLASTGAGNSYFTGNLGIGTTAPLGNLHVNGASPIIVLSNTSGSTNKKNFYLSNTADTFRINLGNDAWNGWTALFTVDSSGNVGIGNTGPSYKLDVVSAGATTARFGTASGDKVVVGGGSGKIDVGTVDPIYTIGGKHYSTYLPGMTGQNEETAGHVECSISHDQCAYTIDFRNLKEGTGLWLLL